MIGDHVGDHSDGPAGTVRGAIRSIRPLTCGDHVGDQAGPLPAPGPRSGGPYKGTPVGTDEPNSLHTPRIAPQDAP
jgi:hypothetical protein